MPTNDASSPKGKRRKGPEQQPPQAHNATTHRSQSIHRAMNNVDVRHHDSNEASGMNVLKVASTLSEGGKMILKNLSINSSYSAEFADLYGDGMSPMNTHHVNHHHSRHYAASASAASQAQEVMVGEEMIKMASSYENEKTPKKRNTSNKKSKDYMSMAPHVLRLDDHRTPAPSRERHSLDDGGLNVSNISHYDDGSSPTMFDLIGGAETPTTGILMNNILRSELGTDDMRSLNGHLRGQSFTPLPIMMRDNVLGDDREHGHGGGNGAHSLSITSQMSWNIPNDGSSHADGESSSSPRLEITPNCFGLLDSTKSIRSGMTATPGGTAGSGRPLGSPKSFWKDNAFVDSRRDGGCVSSAESGKQTYQQDGVKSIMSILSPTMREMDIVQHQDPHDGMSNLLNEGGDGHHQYRSTSPLPLYYENNRPQDENGSIRTSSYEEIDHHSMTNIDTIKTPLRRPSPSGVQSSPMPSNPATHAHPMHVHSSPWGDHSSHWGARHGNYAPSPIPHHHHHTAAASPYRDGPLPQGPSGYHPHHGMYNPAAHHTSYNPHERVRNLRGNGPPRHQMPPQHHLPPPSYHHFSPLTNVVPRGRYGIPVPGGGHHSSMMPHHLDMMVVAATSKRKCVPIKPPIPSKFQGDMEKYKDAKIPEFNNLVNFPGHMNNNSNSSNAGNKQQSSGSLMSGGNPNVPEGMKCCVMCGQACPCSSGTKNKKSSHGASTSTQSKSSGGASGSGSVAPLGDSTGNNNNKSATTTSSSNNACNTNFPNIPTQNKGLCTICDVNVWIVTNSGLEIKWCKGCKNFRSWASFGDKGLATKCVRCRERQREKYASTKERTEKEKRVTAGKNRREQRQEQGQTHHQVGMAQHHQQQQVRPAAVRRA